MAQTDLARVQKGILIPGKGDLKKIVARLQRELKANPKLAAAFKRKPREILGAMGLFEDAQAQLLREAGVADRICVLTCVFSCFYTDCCITDIRF